MKLIHTATTLLLMMMVMTYQAVQAQKCSDVCPNEDRKGCWVNIAARFCDSLTSNQLCDAWCNCNMFGRNCDPCGTCNRGLVDVTTLAEVDDYSEYMA